jgi:hypothetical protein
VIPVAWEEIVALELGTLEGSGAVTRITSDSRVSGPGDLSWR